MIKKISLCAFLLVSSAAAFSADKAPSSPMKVNPNNFYGYIGAGFVNQEGLPNGQDFSESSLTLGSSQTSSVDQTTTGARIALGYMPVSDKKVSYGLEFGVTSFGRAKYSADTISQTLELNYYGADILAVISRKAFENLLLTMKFGVVREFVDTETENLISDVDSNDEYLFETALSLGYAIKKDTAISLSYIHTFGNSPDLVNSGNANNAPTMDMGLIGISHRF